MSAPLAAIGGRPTALTNAVRTLRAQAHRRLAGVRALGVFLFLGISLVQGYARGLVDWRVYVPPLGIYALFALALLVLVRRGPSALAAAAVPLIDVPAVCWLQATSLPLSPFPAGVAGWSLGLFALLVVLASLSIKWQVIYGTVFTASLAEAFLQHRAGVGVGPMFASTVVLHLIAVLTHWAANQFLKYLQELIAEQAERSRLLDSVSDAVIATDPNLRITAWNPAAELIYGWSKPEALGKDATILLRSHLESDGPVPPIEWLQRGNRLTVELTQERKDGSRVQTESSAMALIDERGTFTGVVSVNRDVTDRHLAHQALEQALFESAVAHAAEKQRAEDFARVNEQLVTANHRILEEQQKAIHSAKLASVGLMAAGVAHEINNPLTGVQNCLVLARRAETAEAKREHYFDAIDDAIRRIGRTVQALLEYSRPRPQMTLAPVDVQRMLFRCVPLLEPALKAAKVELTLDVRPGEASALADEPQLIQAAMNVLLNAIHASPPGTEIVVRVETVADQVHLRFRDQGEGIAPEHLPRVLDPFFTTKKEGQGTGLGLTVTQSILEGHGGRLELESVLGRGTEVTFTLPVAVKTAPAAHPGQPASNSASETARS